MSAASTDLRSQGYRFVRRGLLFLWVHPLDVQAGDLDTTDMTEAEFEALFRSTEGCAA